MRGGVAERDRNEKNERIIGRKRKRWRRIKRNGGKRGGRGRKKGENGRKERETSGIENETEYMQGKYCDTIVLEGY